MARHQQRSYYRKLRSYYITLIARAPYFLFGSPGTERDAFEYLLLPIAMFISLCKFYVFVLFWHFCKRKTFFHEINRSDFVDCMLIRPPVTSTLFNFFFCCQIIHIIIREGWILKWLRFGSRHPTRHQVYHLLWHNLLLGRTMFNNNIDYDRLLSSVLLIINHTRRIKIVERSANFN